MYWRKRADGLKEELKLHTEPVAVTLTGAPALEATPPLARSLSARL